MSDCRTAEYKRPNIFKQIYWWFKRVPRRFEKSNYEKHALREFRYAGWIDENGKYNNDMQELLCKQVLQLLKLFGKHGHSGTSAPYATNLFKTLSKFEPIGPIKCTDDEWETEVGPFQNKRFSSVFKDTKNSKPYYLDAIVWKEESGSCFTGAVEGVRSRQFIKLPFTPKSFYIDVLKDIDGNSFIKDKKQLLEVEDYYDMDYKVL